MKTRHFSGRLRHVWLIGLSVGLLLSLLVVVPVYAAPSCVNPTGTGGCFSSIQAAINDAGTVDGDTITVAAGTYSETVSVTKSVAIAGAGASTTMVDGSSGPPTSVFFINPGITASISGLTIQGGVAAGDDGGGVHNLGVSLTLTNDVIRENQAFQGNGGGIENEGTLVLVNSTIVNNVAVATGPGGFGGGLFNGNGGTATITGSTINDNVAASASGGGIYNDLTGTMMIVTNSTISRNLASQSGGGIESHTALNLKSSTISGNSSSEAGGVFSCGCGAVTLTDTIIADNVAQVFSNSSSPVNPDVEGPFIGNGHNLIGNDTGSSGFLGSDIRNVAAGLKSLANNGGTTQTVALRSGSPAVDAGGSCPGVTTDQTGATRTRGPACDIGAFEYTPVTPTVNSASAPIGGGSMIFTGSSLQRTSAVTIDGASAPVTAVAPDGSTLSVNAPAHAAGTFIAIITNPGNLSASTNFAFIAGATTALTITGFPTTVSAGGAITFNVVAKDASSNTANGYLGTVHFTTTDPLTTLSGLPADYTFMTADQGVHPFTVTLKTAGIQSITITDTPNSLSVAQPNIAVAPGAATHFSLAGAGSSQSGADYLLTVTARDAFENAATTYPGTVRLTTTDTSARLPANHTFAPQDNGLTTFTLTLNTAGTPSIVATDLAVVSITGTKVVTVTGPGIFGVGPSTTAVTPFSGPEAGGTAITITGNNLTGATVSVGGSACLNPKANADGTMLTCVTTAHAPATVDVVVTISSGSGTAPHGFTYVPAGGVPPPPPRPISGSSSAPASGSKPVPIPTGR